MTALGRIIPVPEATLRELLAVAGRVPGRALSDDESDSAVHAIETVEALLARTDAIESIDWTASGESEGRRHA